MAWGSRDPRDPSCLQWAFYTPCHALPCCQTSWYRTAHTQQNAGGHSFRPLPQTGSPPLWQRPRHILLMVSTILKEVAQNCKAAFDFPDFNAWRYQMHSEGRIQPRTSPPGHSLTPRRSQVTQTAFQPLHAKTGSYKYGDKARQDELDSLCPLVPTASTHTSNMTTSACPGSRAEFLKERHYSFIWSCLLQGAIWHQRG